MTTRDAALEAKFRSITVLAGRAENRFARTAPSWTARESSSDQERHLPMRPNWFTVLDAVIASKLTNLYPMLEGDRKNAKALRVAPMKSYRWFMEGVAFATLARFESLHAICYQNFHDWPNASIQSVKRDRKSCDVRRSHNQNQASD